MDASPPPDELEALRARCAALEARTRDLDVLRRFATAMLEVEGDVPGTLWELATQVMGALGLEDCVIYLREGEWLHQRAAFGPKNPMGTEILHPIRIRVGEGIVGTAAASGLPQLVPDTRVDGRYILDDAPRLSELAVPLVVDGVVEGVLDSEHSTAGFYTPWHVDLFVALASVAAARIHRARLADERRRLQELDPLSGQLNRRTLLARADDALRAGPVAMVFLDIDGFGRLNDTYGPSLGDALLREAGRRIAAEVGPAGFVGRSGADEFVVVTHPDTASPLAQRLRMALASPFELDGRLLGAETLARWTDPTNGPIPPALFIAAAEESGHIAALGRHLRARTLAHLAGVASAGLCFNVNVSALELGMPGFGERLLAEIAETAVPLDALAVELTETALLSGEGEALRNLEVITAAGLRLVLDDFGTGYASLSSLTSCPFGGVKIDRQFVLGMASRPKDAAVVRAILSLARSMGMTVTAEGVETAAHAALLRDAGCEQAQGWAFGRPMPFARFAELMA